MEESGAAVTPEKGTWRRRLGGRLGRSIAIGTVAVGVVGGAAYALAGSLDATAVSSSTSPASTTAIVAASTGAKCAKTAASGAVTTAATTNTCRGVRIAALRRLLARTSHASLLVQDKQGNWVTVDVDRGTVQSLSTSSITIVRPDGATVSETVNSKTKFRRTTESSLVKGDNVVLVEVSGAARDVVALGATSGAPT